MDGRTQDRLRQEYKDLLQRKSALKAFILRDDFEDLPEEDRRDLREQSKHMDAYWHVVARRAQRHLPEFAEEYVIED
jgi:hypothetical protein